MLAPTQLAAFAREGFIVLPNAVDEESCDHLVEKTWQRLPSTWQRDAADTWTGNVSDSCHVASLDYRRGLLKYQKGDLIDDPVVTRALAAGSLVERMARSLTGVSFAPIRCRGLYPNVPPPNRSRLRSYVAPHIEAHPATLIALVYLNDVEHDAGGLLVWPGSHKPMYAAFESKLDFAVGERYAQIFASYSRLKPIQLTGSKGDVVLIHHRLLHAPSLNRSDKIRFAFLCDYTFANFRTLSTQAPGSLWEDWPSLSGLDQPGCDTQSLYDMKAWLDTELIGEQFSADTESTQNKRDATDLARARHEGDVWLVASDAEDAPLDCTLDPTGSELNGIVDIRLNGLPLRSQSRNGFVCRLALIDGGGQLEVRTPRKLRIKLITIQLPFTESRILLAPQEHCEPGSHIFTLTVSKGELNCAVLPRQERVAEVASSSSATRIVRTGAVRAYSRFAKACRRMLLPP